MYLVGCEHNCTPNPIKNHPGNKKFQRYEEEHCPKLGPQETNLFGFGAVKARIDGR
jgi:hypothetical protein